MKKLLIFGLVAFGVSFREWKICMGSRGFGKINLYEFFVFEMRDFVGIFGPNYT